MNSIRFANKKCLNITSDEIKDKINAKLPIVKRSYKFLDKNTIFELKNNPHLFCLNTFGPKYFLFATTYAGKNYTVFIHKKNGTMIVARYRFDELLYKDTLFEGEMIKDSDNNWFFYITDIYMDKGIDVTAETIEKRLIRIHHIFDKMYVEDNCMGTCKLVVKKYFDYDQIATCHKDYVSQLKFRVNGFLFKNNSEFYSNDIDTLYIFPECQSKGTKEIIEKPKIDVGERRHVVLKIKTTGFPDVYQLYCKDDAEYGFASIPDLTVSEMMNNLFENSDEHVMECSFNMSFKKWIPIKKSEEELDKEDYVIEMEKTIQRE